MDEPTGFELHTQENWTLLADLVNIHNPLFDKTLFLMGYDFSSNIYLIQGEYCSLIDPGNDYTAFMQMLDLGIKPPDIKKVAVTHGHHDHVMGVLELFRGYRGYGELDVEVIMHEAGPEEFQKMVRDIGCRITQVKGGETINLSGFDFEVIHTPGHTIDGICFYHAPTRTVFTGDTVLPLAMAEVDSGVGGRLDHYFYAIRTLLKREIDHLMPGHGGVAVNIGRWVIEETFNGLIMRLVGAETSFLEGATTLAQKGLLEEALFYVNKELAKQADNLRALEFKAFLLNDLGRAQEALEAFDQVLARQPDHLHALLGKGAALMGLGRYDESLPLFDRLMREHPEMKEAQVYQGMALYLAGRQDEAMEIEGFKEEFLGRFKEQLEQRRKE
ncbi:MAG: MBL fold metallo-hydrolase [Deltaproteobacteria bacterium]|nr:MBL fold metallo-hydrolase [Deltaproteobacteria bacterium]